MNLIDFLSTPWAIVPDRLRELQAIYATHLRGEKIDIAAIEARLGRPLANDQKAYALQDGTGVAVLDIAGVISPKANMFTRISGGASANLLLQQVESMKADAKVKAALLNFDTPGGNVLGIPALADAIRALAAVKPTVAASTGMMASAGIWLGTAANAVYVGGSTDFIGSIGVVATHAYDPKTADVQTTEITAGKYKRLASDKQPLSAEGRAYMQAQVDELYRVFVDAVAANRNASAEDVLAHMADGRIFIGAQAVDAGLADGIATIAELVNQLDANPAAFANRRRASFAGTRPGATALAEAGAHADALFPPAAGVATDHVPLAAEPVPPQPPTLIATGATLMTPQELAAFAAANPEAVAAFRAEGSAAERARIQAVREQSMPGHQALIEQLAADGTTTGPEAAMQVLAAERARLGATAAARAADAPKPVPQAVDGEGDAKPGPRAAARRIPAGYAMNDDRAQLDAEARAYIAAHPGTDYLAAIKAVQQSTLQGA